MLLDHEHAAIEGDIVLDHALHIRRLAPSGASETDNMFSPLRMRQHVPLLSGAAVLHDGTEMDTGADSWLP